MRLNCANSSSLTTATEVQIVISHTEQKILPANTFMELENAKNRMLVFLSMKLCRL